MNVLEYNSRGYSMVAQIGQGARKVALAGNSAIFARPSFAATRRRKVVRVPCLFRDGPSMLVGAWCDRPRSICILRQRREQIVGVGTKREGANGRSRSSLLAQEQCLHRTESKYFLWMGGEEGRRAFYANLKIMFAS